MIVLPAFALGVVVGLVVAAYVSNPDAVRATFRQGFDRVG